MPYLALDLDAKKAIPKVARAVGVSPGDVLWGLTELWEHVWSSKRDVVSELVLGGCFGLDPRYPAALVDFGFVEVVDGGFRVRGAGRYLRVSEARSRGAKTTNAKRWGANAGATIEGSENRSTVAQATLNGRSEVALSPSTEHPTPNTQESKIDPGGTPPPDPAPLELLPQEPKSDPVEEVLAHYVEAMAANGVGVRVTESKRKLVRRRLQHWKPEELIQAINGLTWSDWHMGRDPKTNGQAYTGLKYAIGTDEQIEANIQRAQSPPTPKRAGGWR